MGTCPRIPQKPKKGRKNLGDTWRPPRARWEFWRGDDRKVTTKGTSGRGGTSMPPPSLREFLDEFGVEGAELFQEDLQLLRGREDGHPGGIKKKSQIHLEIPKKKKKRFGIPKIPPWAQKIPFFPFFSPWGFPNPHQNSTHDAKIRFSLFFSFPPKKLWTGCKNWVWGREFGNLGDPKNREFQGREFGNLGWGS